MFQENSIETCILSRVKQITSPGWMHERSARVGALGRPRGIGWRGRGEGGSGWGIHVNPWLIHVNVWQKPLQYCKVISLQLIKINGGKKKTRKQILSNEGITCYYISYNRKGILHVLNIFLSRERHQNECMLEAWLRALDQTGKKKGPSMLSFVNRETNLSPIFWGR